MIGLHSRHPCKHQIGLPSLQDNHKWVQVPLNGVDPQTGPNVNRDKFIANDFTFSDHCRHREKDTFCAVFIDQKIMIIACKNAFSSYVGKIK